jgi:hypothetical protein
MRSEKLVFICELGLLKPTILRGCISRGGYAQMPRDDCSKRREPNDGLAVALPFPRMDGEFFYLTICDL